VAILVSAGAAESIGGMPALTVESDLVDSILLSFMFSVFDAESALL
jgi:hypothetical protein